MSEIPSVQSTESAEKNSKGTLVLWLLVALGFVLLMSAWGTLAYFAVQNKPADIEMEQY